MIVANLATYPARRARLSDVVHSIIGQVDQLNVIFNQYESVPDEFRDLPGLNAVIPEHDTRDAGKFYVDVSAADWVFFIDDDIVYPPDYVASTLNRIARIPFEDGLFGYHGSVYRRPRRNLGLTRRSFREFFARDEELIQSSRVNFRFTRDLEHPTYVDQIATNTAAIPGRHMPSYSFMHDSQRFVDVRLARWCHERGLPLVCLPHRGDWMTELRYEETIFRGFTRVGHPYVGREILTYALRNPLAGQAVIGREVSRDA